MGSTVPQIQIRDDGELDEVRALLEELEIDYSVARKEDAPPLPSHLLISSGSWAIETLEEISESPSPYHFLHLIVIDRASRSLRAMLRRQGCDMVARRPVHPTVLRLLLQRALFPGPERRTQERVAIGAQVKVRSGLWSRSALLGEISRKGCGLISHQSFAVGDSLTVSFSDAMREASTVTLVGKVVGVQEDHAVENRGHSIAVVFDPMPKRTTRAIDEIMREHSVGPTGKIDPAPGTPVAGSKPKSVTQERPADRRVSPRGHYTRLVLARESGNIQSLIGRDLSLGGMRVGAAPELDLGSKLELIIYGQAGVLPVMVAAEVVRDDGEEGLGLNFGPLDELTRGRLRQIVESLDQFDSPSGNVISEVVGSS